MHRKIIRYTLLNSEGLQSLSLADSFFYNMKDFGWYYCAPASRVNDSMFPGKIKEASLNYNVAKAEVTVDFQKKSGMILLSKETKILKYDARTILPIQIWTDGFRLFCLTRSGF